MNNSPQKDEQSVVQVLQKGEQSLPQSRPASCENDEKKKDRKRKSKQKCISKPRVVMKKLATDILESQHNGDLGSSLCELRSNSSSVKLNENSQSPVTTLVPNQGNISNCETVTQEKVSNCETTHESTSNCEATQNTSNCETTKESTSNSETAQESASNCEITKKSISNCDTTQHSTSNCETAQESTSNCEITKKSISNCEKTAIQGSVSNCETAQVSISNRLFPPTEQLQEGRPAFENDISEPQVLLTRIKTVVLESVSNNSSSRWVNRLRVRPPPIPKNERSDSQIPKNERPATRTAAQNKVNYCELSSSEDDEHKPRKKVTNRKPHRRTSSSDEFSTSQGSDSSGDSKTQKKKRAAMENKQVSASGESDPSYDPKSPKSNARKKANVPVTKMKTKEKHLSEYEKLRRKNIEEKLAFLQSLNFDKVK